MRAVEERLGKGPAHSMPVESSGVANFAPSGQFSSTTDEQGQLLCEIKTKVGHLQPARPPLPPTPHTCAQHFAALELGGRSAL